MTQQALLKRVDDYKVAQGKKALFDINLDETAVLTEEALKDMHRVLGGTGVYRKDVLKVAPIGIMPPDASELQRLVGHFISQLQISKQMFHPIEYAAICHKRILELYPFEDKNEEVAFLALNLLLTQAGYKRIVINEAKRKQYVGVLKAAQHPSHPEIDAFITFIAECVVEQFKEHQSDEAGN